jgi:hypothetical protein
MLKDLLDAARRRLGLSAESNEPAQVPREHIRLSNPYHAIAIHAGPKRCEAVKPLLGKRYLSKEAPRLPLKDCTEPACSCHYRHHDDRRLDGKPLDHNGVPLPHPGRRGND